MVVDLPLSCEYCKNADFVVNISGVLSFNKLNCP